ncbi:MAG: T9SS C-terminal target domain-containing protein [Calditrichaeota bacterium]|nr:MAG: T9SS C-terminal target domain-containing protein [Calditrichota bacterium]
MKILIFLTILLVSNVFGAIHTVTSSNDSGIGTLREKIEISANGDTILFSSNVNTIWLSGEPYVLEDKVLTIDGGSNEVIINRSNGTGGFFYLLNLDSTFTDTMSFLNLSLKNGMGSSSTVIQNLGFNIIIENCNILDCSNNTILLSFSYNYIRIKNTNFYNNTGDYHIISEKVDLKNIKCQNNDDNNFGISSDFAIIENLVFKDNEGHIGIGADSLIFKNSLIASNEFVYPSLRLTSQNGLIRNCTISENVNYSLDKFGGGIYIFDSTNVTIENCTITNNWVSTGQLGGGVYNDGGNVLIKNSIIVDNHWDSIGGVAPSNCYGDFISGGFNIISDSLNSTFTGQTFVDFFNVSLPSVGLLPLADNGGFSKTIGLSPNSIAINNGSQLNSPLTDQRGFLRDSLPDIGAFEFNAVSKIEENEFVFLELFSLSQNYPNPFNPQTLINYELGNWNYESKLVIFNILGEKVNEFTLTEPQGTVVWNGTNFGNKQVASGVFFYRIETGNKFSQTKKMVFIK